MTWLSEEELQIRREEVKNLSDKEIGHYIRFMAQKPKYFQDKELLMKASRLIKELLEKNDKLSKNQALP